MTPGSSLDPILPLPFLSRIPEIRAGEGSELFQRTDGLTGLGIPYRAFYVVWEQCERRAAENYPRYVNSATPHVAQTWLEAVTWFRQMGHPDMEIIPISEKKAQKIRAKEAEAAKKKKAKPSVKDENPASEGDTGNVPNACPKCGQHRTILKEKKRGVKMYRCADCDHLWPRNAPVSRSKAPESKAKGKTAPSKKKTASSKKKRS